MNDLSRALAEHMNPRPSLLRAYLQGPVRDTLLIGLGGLLVAVGFALGVLVR